MKYRRRAREVAFQFLYQFKKESLQELSQTPQYLERKIDQHFEHFEVPKKSRDFSKELICGSIFNSPKIDEIIEKQDTNWKISRMDTVDYNLLRLGIFEILSMQDIAPSITINETIEIAKEFGSEDTPGFVHGILDAVNQNSTSLPSFHQ